MRARVHSPLDPSAGKVANSPSPRPPACPPPTACSSPRPAPAPGTPSSSRASAAASPPPPSPSPGPPASASTPPAANPRKRARARTLGATDALPPGARLPHPADAVLETVGAATWSHSVRSLRPGGTLVLSGATTGDRPPHTELTRIVDHELTVIGSTIATREELTALLTFCTTTGTRPVIDHTFPLPRAAEGFARLAAGHHFGKIVLTV